MAGSSRGTARRAGAHDGIVCDPGVRYPNLAEACSPVLQAARLGDDGHELITRFQRSAAPLLRDVGTKAVRNGVLRDPEQVFDLCCAEVRALVTGAPLPRYVGDTSARRRSLEAADIDLDRACTQANAQFDVGPPEWADAARARPVQLRARHRRGG
jgi:hypothetical protein